MSGIAVIFDMDGVILDSERVYQDIERAMFLEYRAPVSSKEHMSYMGTAESWMWNTVIRKHGLNLNPEEMVIEERRRFIEFLEKPRKIPLMEGLLPLLDDLKHSRIPCLIASSSARFIIRRMLECKDLQDYFSGYAGGDDVRNAKPSPDLYLEAARISGTNPSDCIAIEDSPNGIRSARRAGMLVIGLRHSDQEVDMSEASMVINHLAELDAERIQDVLKEFQN